jgi:hypothetical protein
MTVHEFPAEAERNVHTNNIRDLLVRHAVLGCHISAIFLVLCATFLSRSASYY